MASMPEMLKTISPVDGRVYAERPLADEAEIAAALDRAVAGQRAWRRATLAERHAMLSRAVDAFVADGPDIAEELTRSEAHTSELQSLMRNSYAVFCLKKKTTKMLIT